MSNPLWIGNTCSNDHFNVFQLWQLFPKEINWFYLCFWCPNRSVLLKITFHLQSKWFDRNYKWFLFLWNNLCIYLKCFDSFITKQSSNVLWNWNQILNNIITHESSSICFSVFFWRKYLYQWIDTYSLKKYWNSIYNSVDFISNLYLHV